MISIALLFATLCAAQTASGRPVVQADAVTVILDAFRNRPVVALEEIHGDEGGHAFRLELIRDPRFASVVNDIVVEFGNSRHQDAIDRFEAGLPVADADLRRIWQDTTQAHDLGSADL